MVMIQNNPPKSILLCFPYTTHTSAVIFRQIVQILISTAQSFKHIHTVTQSHARAVGLFNGLLPSVSLLSWSLSHFSRVQSEVPKSISPPEWALTRRELDRLLLLSFQVWVSSDPWKCHKITAEILNVIQPIKEPLWDRSWTDVLTSF